MSRVSNISESNVTLTYYKFNSMDIYHKYMENLRFGGCGDIIEIDESKSDERKHHRGHCVGGVWVSGAVESIRKKIFLFPVIVLPKILWKILCADLFNSNLQ